MNIKHTSFLNIPFQLLNFLLLYIGSVGIESAKLLGLFPCQYRVFASFVLVLGHDVFWHAGDIVEVLLKGRRPCVGDLDRK